MVNNTSPNDDKSPEGESGGNRQSPINIITKDCEIKTAHRNMPPLLIKYPRLFMGLSIQNTGNTWRVDIPSKTSKNSTVSGGPLQHIYRFGQFHCHWGKDRKKGSDHTVDGKSFGAEIHFVHWNSDLYKTMDIAQTSDNGLAVLAIFLDCGKFENKEIDKLLSRMDDIKFKDGKASIEQNIDVEKMFPSNRSYFTYVGSLTTPPYYETVTWIVFANPTKCSEQQIAKFRGLCSCDKNAQNANDSRILTNFRAPQPLNGRTVTRVNQ